MDIKVIIDKLSMSKFELPSRKEQFLDILRAYFNAPVTASSEIPNGKWYETFMISFLETIVDKRALKIEELGAKDSELPEPDSFRLVDFCDHGELLHRNERLNAMINNIKEIEIIDGFQDNLKEGNEKIRYEKTKNIMAQLIKIMTMTVELIVLEQTQTQETKQEKSLNSELGGYMQEYFNPQDTPYLKSVEWQQAVADFIISHRDKKDLIEKFWEKIELLFTVGFTDAGLAEINVKQKTGKEQFKSLLVGVERSATMTELYIDNFFFRKDIFFVNPEADSVGGTDMFIIVPEGMQSELKDVQKRKWYYDKHVIKALGRTIEPKFEKVPSTIIAIQQKGLETKMLNAVMDKIFPDKHPQESAFHKELVSRLANFAVKVNFEDIDLTATDPFGLEHHSFFQYITNFAPSVDLSESLGEFKKTLEENFKRQLEYMRKKLKNSDTPLIQEVILVYSSTNLGRLKTMNQKEGQEMLKGILDLIFVRKQPKKKE